MAFVSERPLNLVTKVFDETDKFIDIEPAKAVADQAVVILGELKQAITDFALDNQADLREMHMFVTSEQGSRQNYRIQSIEFAKNTFDEYIAKVISIPEAAKNGNISDEMCLNAGFFERDRQFVVALYCTDENEYVAVPAEDAYEELGYMPILASLIDEYSKQIIDKASMVPEKKDVMDGALAKEYDTCLMAVRLMATSMVRFCALTLKQIITTASRLQKLIVEDQERWSKPWAVRSSEDEENPGPGEESRWAIFV